MCELRRLCILQGYIMSYSSIPTSVRHTNKLCKNSIPTLYMPLTSHTKERGSCQLLMIFCVCDDMLFQLPSKLAPSEYAQECTKAVVDSACRGDMYQTEPSWPRFGFWLRVFCPELLEKHFQLIVETKKMPATPNKDD